MNVDGNWSEGFRCVAVEVDVVDATEAVVAEE